MPILDGLDEIPETVRGPAITRINDALRPGVHVVVTCRTEDYRDAVRPLGGPEVRLRAAGAIQLRPLNAETVASYLRADAGGSDASARWNPVVAILGTQIPAAQALATPLMVGLARTIYNPRPGEVAAGLRDPAELRSPALGDRAAVERHLFDGLIPAVYRPSPGGHWTAQEARPWLVFLAGHLDRTIGSPDLAWWQLQQAAPNFGTPFAPALVVSLVAVLFVGAGLWLRDGSTVGLAAWGLGFAFGVLSILGLWILVMLRRLPWVGDAAKRPKTPSRGIGFRVRALAGPISIGLIIGIWAGIVGGVKVGLVWGTVSVLGLGLVGGLSGVPGNLAATASPQALLRRDRQAALVLSICAVLAAALLPGLAGALAFESQAALRLGLVFGAGVGIVAGSGSAC